MAADLKSCRHCTVSGPAARTALLATTRTTAATNLDFDMLLLLASGRKATAIRDCVRVRRSSLGVNLSCNNRSASSCELRSARTLGWRSEKPRLLDPFPPSLAEFNRPPASGGATSPILKIWSSDWQAVQRSAWSVLRWN